MNKINLELKHYCSDFRPVRKALKELGAHKEIVKNQKDYFFMLPTERLNRAGRLKLRIEGTLKTLIYYERPDFVKAQDTASVVKLYTLENASLLPLLEQALGVHAIVEKKREVWRKENTVFHLDTVKGVGKIFEIELQKKGTITRKDRQLFKAYQKRILPLLDDVIRGSNVDLVSSK